jgi:hypothetical protein
MVTKQDYGIKMREDLVRRLKMPVLATAVTLTLWCGGCPDERVKDDYAPAMKYNGDGTYSPVASQGKFSNCNTNQN